MDNVLRMLSSSSMIRIRMKCSPALRLPTENLYRLFPGNASRFPAVGRSAQFFPQKAVVVAKLFARLADFRSPLVQIPHIARLPRTARRGSSEKR